MKNFTSSVLLCLLWLPALAVVLASCAPRDPVQRLAYYMEGNFSSQAQAREDSAYFDIRLHIRRVWKERPDGVWFYVEQARADNQDKPYRQRFYRLTQRPDGKLVSEVYIYADPLRFTGAWRDPLMLGMMNPDSLIQREGCAVALAWRDDAFVGGTEGKNCPSDLRGAYYATSEVTITSDMLLSWDRGFDANDRQMWGATKGAYRFIKQ